MQIRNYLDKLSIRTKITLIIISVSLIAIVFGFFIISLVNINNLKEDLKNQSLLVAKLTGVYSEYALIYEDTLVARENLNNLKLFPNIINAVLYDSTGNIFASLKTVDPLYSNLKADNTRSEYTDDYLFVYEPIISSEGVNIGAVFLRVSLADLDKNVKEYILWMIGIIILVTVLLILLARRFQQIISKPILKLAAMTKEIIDTNDYTMRIHGKTNDEIGILYDGFNNMLEKIVRNQIAMLTVQNELHDSREQFSTFMEMLPAAAYIKNPDSSYFYVNKFLVEKFNAGQWFGNTPKSDLPSEKRMFSSSRDHEALNNVQHFDEFIYDTNNQLRYFETWKFPLNREDKPTLIGGIAIDITTRKLAEKKVNFYIKELERNNQELEEFNYVASHDLREPLRTITSYCDLLAEDIGEGINEMVREDINFITDATTRMNVLIQDLLQLSRAGRVEFESKPVDLNYVLRTVLKDLELKIKETNTLIEFGKLPVLMGDASQLGRVFQNIITNAIKFKSENDPIIKIESLEKSNTFEIIISDNGIGIEREYHQQIFSAFKRLHSRDKYEGTGIGLAICKKIIERHHGTIQIDSEPGKGSKFIIILMKESREVK